MNPNELLSDITVYAKYARYIPETQSRESWHDLVNRNGGMLTDQINRVAAEEFKEPALTALAEALEKVHDKRILPSMRSLQFGGLPIELANNRVYNCGFMPIDDPAAFSEAMFLLLGGTGLGYSVQSYWVDQLPVIVGCKKRKRKFVIDDSIEGWADAVKVLVEAHFYGKSKPAFDFRQIREKGAPLITSGGKAPGPAPLKECLLHLETMLEQAVDRRLTPLEVHHMICYIADAVLAGGIRRAALICLFDNWDMDMLTCKSGDWWETHPHLGRANNSAVFVRGYDTESTFREVMKRCKESMAGEPGVYWTNHPKWGTNPCCEIALRPFQFCNLTEINGAAINSKDDLISAATSAAALGTIQASFTDFHYLRDIWKDTTEKDALIGVGITGACNPVLTKNHMLQEAAQAVKVENARVAKLLGINAAARTTCVKPAGTTSLVVGSSSGIHAWHAPYYLRRIRFGNEEAILKYLKATIPDLVEPCYEKPHLQSVVSIPQKATSDVVRETELVEDLLERVKTFHEDWVREGHIDGANTHNVSCTVSVREHEWDTAIDWMWRNRDSYNGIAVLPYDGGTYTQAPFEDINEDTYKVLAAYLIEKNVDLSSVIEEDDNTDLKGELACSNGACVVPE